MGLMGLDDHTEDDLKRLADVYQGLSYWARLAILIGIDEGKNLNEIADFVGITRGAMQDHMEKLLNAELIYKPDEPGTTYALTPLGEFYIDRIKEDSELIGESLDQLAEAEEEVGEEYQEELDILADSELADQKKVGEKINTKKWEKAMDRVRSILFDRD